MDAIVEHEVEVERHANRVDSLLHQHLVEEVRRRLRPQAVEHARGRLKTIKIEALERERALAVQKQPAFLTREYGRDRVARCGEQRGGEGEEHAHAKAKQQDETTETHPP